LDFPDFMAAEFAFDGADGVLSTDRQSLRKIWRESCKMLFMGSPKIFVSYSRHDEGLVKPLAGLLRIADDDAVWLDISSLKPGDDWKLEIEKAIEASQVLVLCWCCAAKMSQAVAYEIGVAMRSGEKRLVPVILCDAELPQPLAGNQWIDLRGQVPHKCLPHSEPFTPPKGGLIKKEDLQPRERPTMGDDSWAWSPTLWLGKKLWDIIKPQPIWPIIIFSTASGITVGRQGEAPEESPADQTARKIAEYFLSL
jgi:hypothetical protein